MKRLLALLLSTSIAGAPSAAAVGRAVPTAAKTAPIGRSVISVQ